MAKGEQKGSATAPILAICALAGVAGLAYLAYRRLADQGGAKVGNLMEMAEKASRALEQRLDEFAVAS